MTTTVEQYRSIKRLEESAKDLGFKVGVCSYRGDKLVLTPLSSYKELNATLPTFSRDAEFGNGGTVDRPVANLSGWERALVYVKTLKVTAPEKIKDKEWYWNNLYKTEEEKENKKQH